jgi:hypothetical protein
MAGRSSLWPKDRREIVVQVARASSNQHTDGLEGWLVGHPAISRIMRPRRCCASRQGSEGTSGGYVLQEFQTAARLRAKPMSASCSYILWKQRHAKRQLRSAARTRFGRTTRTLDARGGIRDSASSDARQVDEPYSVQSPLIQAPFVKACNATRRLAQRRSLPVNGSRGESLGRSECTLSLRPAPTPRLAWRRPTTASAAPL